MCVRVIYHVTCRIPSYIDTIAVTCSIDTIAAAQIQKPRAIAAPDKRPCVMSVIHHVSFIHVCIHSSTAQQNE